MAYAELAALRPRAGGEYVYLREAYGGLAGFLTGWTSFVAGFAGAMAASAMLIPLYLESLHSRRRQLDADACNPVALFQTHVLEPNAHRDRGDVGFCAASTCAVSALDALRATFSPFSRSLRF